MADPNVRTRFAKVAAASWRMKRFARDWNRLGRRNAYGAILTGESGDIARWQPEEFFATGRADAERFMAALSRIAPAAARGTALDFGCGVGRVTRALAAHFASVTGVDVAPAMIAKARALNEDVRNCEFIVNPEPNLAVLSSGSFDVVYCRLVLQHVPRAMVSGYISELVRVLVPGGVLMFQLPEEIDSPLTRFLHAPVVGTGLKRRLPRSLVRAYRRLKYAYLVATSGPRMRMSGMPAEAVSAVIATAGGVLLTTVADESHGIPDVAGFEYWVTK